jgi:hypothetical protein
MIAKRDLVREMIRHIAQRMMEMNAERALQDVPRSVGRVAGGRLELHSCQQPGDGEFERPSRRAKYGERSSGEADRVRLSRTAAGNASRLRQRAAAVR